MAAIKIRKGCKEEGIIRNKNSAWKLNTLPDIKKCLKKEKNIEQSFRKKDKNRKCDKRYEKQELDKGKEIQHLNNQSLMRDFEKHSP